LVTDTSCGQPPIGDYALISDCHSGALVSRMGSIDWCCMPRVDSASCFGRLLDWEKGGFSSIEPAEPLVGTSRSYLGHSMVLETVFDVANGRARVIDCFVISPDGPAAPMHSLVRIIEGVQGRVQMRLRVVPRFDYGEVRPWLHRAGELVFGAIGGSEGLLITFEEGLTPGDDHDLDSEFTVRQGQRIRLTMSWAKPERLTGSGMEPPLGGELDEAVERTINWWEDWASKAHLDSPDRQAVLRSALVLRALTNAQTGAMAAALTTSLPEYIGGSRNWDYRFSWIRDSSLSVRSLADVGCTTEANEFRRFMQRSAAGSARDLQIMYGLGGERRLTEIELDGLAGYRCSQPVRIGNSASKQLQLDAYGELMLLSWRSHLRGFSADDDYWRFLVDIVETVAERWTEPDSGIWEIRGEPLHFVHSKVMCWITIDRGIALAEETLRSAPVSQWKKVAREIRETIEDQGYDRRRGVFVEAFGREDMDAALLMLPVVGFIDFNDDRMIRTVAEIQKELEVGGLIRRYRTDRVPDGIQEGEGTFLACTFWLVECLARQGRVEEAREYFDRAAGACNDLGLMAEEFDHGTGQLLGNFPQGLSHLSHIAAAVALADVSGLAGSEGRHERPDLSGAIPSSLGEPHI
jgi:GH15 family glucan-1,4-alpha-glucosidase